MKQFFCKLTIFLIGVLIGLIVLTLPSYLGIKQTPYNIPVSKHVLVCGDSRPECCFNDSVLSTYHNVAKSGRNYLYSYYVLKKVLKDSPQIDTVLFSIDYEGLNPNRLTLKDAGNHDTYYFPLLDLEGMRDTKMNVKSFVVSALNLPKKCPHFFYKYVANLYGMNYLGGFLSLERNKLDVDIERSMSRKDGEFVSTTKGIDYLNKCISLCNAQRKTFVLVFPPLYSAKDYRPDYLQIQNQTLELLKGSFLIADYTNFSLPIEAYGDVEHLNHKGAKMFSETIVKKGLEMRFVEKHKNIKTHSY